MDVRGRGMTGMGYDGRYTARTWRKSRWDEMRGCDVRV